jgi:hypothetical protein
MMSARREAQTRLTVIKTERPLRCDGHSEILLGRVHHDSPTTARRRNIRDDVRRTPSIKGKIGMLLQGDAVRPLESRQGGAA